MSRLERQKSQDKTECGLRVARGEHAGLGARWSHGIADLGPGTITLAPFVGGVRFLKKKPVRVDVVRVDRYSQRDTTIKEAFLAMPGLAVVQVHTSDAMLDWAIHPDVVSWATQLVTSSMP